MISMLTLTLLCGLAASGRAAILAKDGADVSVETEKARTCAELPCQNGGRCLSTTAGYQCKCPLGYWGATCAGEMPCKSNPCQNGARCTDISTRKFQCACTANYAGPVCDSPLPCTESPCGARGKCTNLGLNKHSCACAANYFGENCERYMPCYYKPCRNGGTCANVDRENYACACPAGKTGRTCESQLDCSFASLTLPELHARVSTAGSSSVGSVRSCACLSGWYYYSRCQVKCGSDGRWTTYSSYACNRRITCGSPPSLRSGGEVSYTSMDYGSVANYTCSAGYELGKYTHMRCSASGPSGRWVNSAGISTAPTCTRMVTCGPPPAIQNATMVTVNGTTKYGAAQYVCDEGFRMVGDGRATCTCVGSAREKTYTSRYSSSYTTQEVLKWMWLPQCKRTCAAPAGENPGSRDIALVEISECSASTEERYPDEHCRPATVYGVHANASQADDTMTFNGGELCVGRPVRYRKYVKGGSSTSYAKLYMTNSTECESFCIPGVHGYRRLMVDESVSHTNDGFLKIERKYLKFRTLE